MGGTPTYEDMVQLYVDCAGLNVESLKHHKECTGRTPPSPPPPNAAKEELSPPIDTTNFPYHRAMNVIYAIWDAFEIALIPVVLAFVAALLKIIIFYLRILLKLLLIKCMACCQFLTCWLWPTMGQSTAEVEMMAIEVEPLVPSPPTHRTCPVRVSSPSSRPSSSSPSRRAAVSGSVPSPAASTNANSNPSPPPCFPQRCLMDCLNMDQQLESPEHVMIVFEEGLRRSSYENVARRNSMSMRDAGSFDKDEKLREYEERAYQILEEVGIAVESESPEHVMIVCEEGLRRSSYENVAPQNSMVKSSI